ncbi:MAG: hypothetical protein ACFFG0_18535 [Candidatus Thorarchaeota archaeon]
MKYDPVESDKPKRSYATTKTTIKRTITIRNTDQLIDIIIKNIDPLHEVNARMLDLRTKLTTSGGFNNRNNTYHVKGMRLILDFLTREEWIQVPTEVIR